MKSINIVFAISLYLCFAVTAGAVEQVNFNFETSQDEWYIPDWAVEQRDCVGKSLSVSSAKSSSGEKALEVMCDFPGDVWAAAIVDVETDLDLTGYTQISADILVPEEANSDLYLGRFIITAGPNWSFIESRNKVVLTPGKWTTITASFDQTEETEKSHWRFRKEKGGILQNKRDVKRIAIRIEYNANPWQAGKPYTGPVYVDNVVIE